MRYVNTGTAVLFWQGKTIKPGEACPEDCEPSWLAPLLAAGYVTAQTSEKAEKAAKKSDSPLWTPKSMKSEEV